MANLRAELKRSFLQSLFDAVVDATATIDLASGVQITDTPIVTFLEALKAFQRLGFNALKGGKLSVGSSGMSHEVRWAHPQNWNSFSQDEIYGMAQEFREIYADSKAILASQGNASPSDTVILATMLADDRLQTVTSLHRDHTMLRWSQRY